MKGLSSIVVIGDRVLVQPDDAEGRTKVGLFLPPGALEKEAAQSGRVVKVGPGTPVPDNSEFDDEPWKHHGHREARFIPMQARCGDYAIFLRKAAVEIKFEETRYLVVPQGALLVLIRKDEIPDTPPVSDC